MLIMSTKCIICNKNNFSTIKKNVRDSKHHSVIQCKNCTHFQIKPIPKDSELNIGYGLIIRDSGRAIKGNCLNGERSNIQ